MEPESATAAPSIVKVRKRTQVIFPQLVIEKLYIGNAYDADDRLNLKGMNITHILTVQLGNYPKYPKEFTYKHVEVLDMDKENLRLHFDACFAFIEDAVANGGGVLVHCGAGISRSATIVIAYLMKVKKWRYSEARAFLQEIRPIIEPNDGFVLQLSQFEKELFEALT